MVAAAYGAFLLTTLRLLAVEGGADCGCFGGGGTVANASHAVLNLVACAAGMLARAALAGSAMVVAPWRFLTRPVSAMEVIGPENCPGGTQCENGYSAFCCQVNHGANRCPPGTFIGGWWMCTAYSGGGLCQAEGVRFYVDCNCLPGRSCGGCRCANNTCNEMRINCNVFRYGQCNTGVGGITPVLCRVVVCQNPATIDGFSCDSSLAIGDTVCSQTSGCLTPLVQQLPGAGGA